MSAPQPWCLRGRGRSHEWLIDSPSGGKPYAWGTCKFCNKRRAFRTGWPTRYDKNAETKHRQNFERREKRREKKANGRARIED